jgi:hypothetical protein
LEAVWGASAVEQLQVKLTWVCEQIYADDGV